MFNSAEKDMLVPWRVRAMFATSSVFEPGSPKTLLIIGWRITKHLVLTAQAINQAIYKSSYETNPVSK